MNNANMEFVAHAVFSVEHAVNCGMSVARDAEVYTREIKVRHSRNSSLKTFYTFVPGPRQQVTAFGALVINTCTDEIEKAPLYAAIEQIGGDFDINEQFFKGFIAGWNMPDTQAGTDAYGKGVASAKEVNRRVIALGIEITC